MKQIIKNHIRGYETEGDRRKGVRMLLKQGFNYFVGFKDVSSNFALQYGKATWETGLPYFLDCYPMFYGTRITCFRCGQRHTVTPAGCTEKRIQRQLANRSLDILGKIDWNSPTPFVGVLSEDLKFLLSRTPSDCEDGLHERRLIRAELLKR